MLLGIRTVCSRSIRPRELETLHRMYDEFVNAVPTFGDADRQVFNELMESPHTEHQFVCVCPEKRNDGHDNNGDGNSHQARNVEYEPDIVDDDDWKVVGFLRLDYPPANFVRLSDMGAELLSSSLHIDASKMVLAGSMYMEPEFRNSQALRLLTQHTAEKFDADADIKYLVTESMPFLWPISKSGCGVRQALASLWPASRLSLGNSSCWMMFQTWRRGM